MKAHPRRWRRLLLRSSVVAVTMLLTVALCEVAVRLFHPQVLFPRYVTDGGFGIRGNVPNAEYWHTSPEMRVHFRINAMGIRSDREYTFEKPAGMLRLVGLGDSFTQGYEVALEECYLFRLEGLLQAAGYAAEVINLGVSGHGSAEELIMLREFGLRFDPDVVIVGYFQNDPDDNIRSRLFLVDDNGTLVRNAHSYLPAIGIRDTLYSFWAYRWLAENSQLFSLAREGMAGVVKRRMVESNLPAASASPAPSTDETPAILTARLLDEIKRACQQRGIGFVLLDIPSHGLGPSNLPVDHLERVAVDDIIRTGPRLRAEGPDAYLYRRHGHHHWTPRGHEIASELLADKLTGVLGGAAKPRSAGAGTP